MILLHFIDTGGNEQELEFNNVSEFSSYVYNMFANKSGEPLFAKQDDGIEVTRDEMYRLYVRVALYRDGYGL